ncbi:hypothetical protein NDN08_005650 [Rhodosorus marinus]|uniref:alkaline phosphatase n=1 Tax=Rhodosorus marinus TaxID=101924 RepID=A0AAV8V315_9RHOD|nr:hypothetical protein NDN08_005650 [Rhodosorus marinus]
MLKISTVLVLLSAAWALQKPEQRHYGCIKGSDVCIYPTNTAEFQCETVFDFEVEWHVKSGKKASIDDIKVTFTVLETGKKYGVDQFFRMSKGKERRWPLEVYDSVVDDEAEVYDSIAIKWSNVYVREKFGKGDIKVMVVTPSGRTSIMWNVHKPTKRIAKNVILLVGDGMNINMVSAARIISRGMADGKYKDLMHMQSLPYFGLINPAGVDSIITDSANSASTFNSGFKSSVNALGVYVDSNTDDGANLDHPKVELLAEHVRDMGMSVGVVSTAEIQDATPAACYAHTRRRGDKAEITRQGIEPCPGCRYSVIPDVLIGGGGRYFLPSSSWDGSDMYEAYEKAGYTVTYTKKEMVKAAKSKSTKKLLNISHYGNMNVWLDRNVYTDNLKVQENSPNPDKVKDASGQPNLDEMVDSAIKVLSKNENGFYLMVEAASIDKSAHPLDTHRLLADTIELDNVVGNLKKWIKENGDDTLLLVTADHGHGWDVYGTVDTHVWKQVAEKCEDNADITNLCKDVKCGAQRFKNYFASDVQSPVRELALSRRIAVGTYAGAGYPDYEDKDGDGFPDEWDVRTVLAAGANNFPDHTENFRVSPTSKRPALFSAEVGAYLNNPEDDPDGIFISGNIGPRGSTAVHSMCDVGIYGYGPGAEHIKPNMDNTAVFHIMAEALGLGTNGKPMEKDEMMPKEIEMCKNTAKECHCGKVTESCFKAIKPFKGFCEKVECEKKACICTPGAMGYVAAGTPLCKKSEEKVYEKTGPMQSKGIPCVRAKVMMP